ncbi:antibiotic biosynthesis monooxygenase family protein [Lysobacter sp. P5_B9]
MFAVIWEFEVRAGCEAAFAALYGNEGEWVALFREYSGFVDTELLRDVRPADADSTRWVTIDRWSSQDAYDAFLTAAQSRYAHIDARGDALTLAERRIGAYTTP